MRKQILIILYLTSLITTELIACDCKTPKSLKAIQVREFENSNCVFIGKVLKIDPVKNTFKIEVIESFKGVENGKVYRGIYDKFCGPAVNSTGKWLIYGSTNPYGRIEINACGLSRSFQNPQHNISASKPPTPPKDPNPKKSIADEKRAEWKLRAKTDLEKEIAVLQIWSE